MAERQTIHVAIDGGELEGTHSLQWETMRREITGQGALGVANHTGLIGVTLNSHVAVRLWLHEDRNGYVVIDVLDARTDERVARVDVELFGLVPPRLGAKHQRKDRRFDSPGES